MVKKYCIQFIALFFICEVASAQFGVLDPSFGNSGKVVTSFGEENSFMKALVIQSDGKILAGGNVVVQGHSQFGLARYNSDGIPDLTFGIGGKSAVLVSDFHMYLLSIALQSDGKIVASGKLFNADQSDSQPVLVRYNDDGTLDTAFGNQGMVIAFENGDVIEIQAITLQSNGKIIAAGYVTNQSVYSNFLLLRFNSNGTPDSDFGVNGVINMRFRAKDYAKSVTILNDGKILVAGTSSDVWNNGYDFDFIVAKFNVDGTLDTSFGDNGKTIVGIANEGEGAMYMKVQPDAKIMVAGEHNGDSYGFEQVRLLSNGIPDTDFGKNGIVLTALPASYMQAVATQVDGKIVATGYYNPGACCSAIRLIRFQTDGSLDPTFGDGGIVSQITDSGQSYALVLQSDGKIIISGGGGIGAGPTHTDFTMYRYTSGLNLSSSDSEMFKNNFIVYPNPIKNSLNLDFNSLKNSILYVDLHDDNGKLISNLIRDRDFHAGQHSLQLDLPETLAEGIYFLKISSDSAVTNIKLIKR